jgi:hypothetical protein
MARTGNGHSRQRVRRGPAALAVAAVGMAAALVGMAPAWAEETAAGAAAGGSAGANVWSSLGPNGGAVNTVVVDPSNPRVLYAGAQGGVFKSLDGGASWRLSSRGLTIQPIHALALEPRRPGTVYAAAGDATTLSVGLFVSRDAGASWSPNLTFSNGFARDGQQEYFSSLAVDPVRPGAVFAASNFSVSLSRDGGASWAPVLGFSSVNPSEGVSVQVAADPARGSVFVYAAGTNSFDPAPYAKLLESADGGATWTDHSAALPAAARGVLAIEPTAPGILYLVQGATIYRSVDGAASWHPVRTAAAPFVTLAAGPHGRVVAGNRASEVVQSADGGRTWWTIAAPDVDFISSFAFGASPDQLYASGNGVGVEASVDGGVNWQPANLGLTGTSVLALAIDPALAARMYALADPDGGLNSPGLWRSPNGGGRWRSIGAGLQASNVFLGGLNRTALLLDPRAPGTVYYNTGGTMAKSLDFGTSWTRVDLPVSCYDSFTLALEPASPSILYAAGGCGVTDCSAWKSLDGGQSWSCLGLANAFRIVPAPSDPAILYGIANVDSFPRQPLLWRSADGGASWAPIDAGLPPARDPFAGAPVLAVDPGNAQRIFAGFPTGVWRSPDGGGHWRERDRGLPLGTAGQFPGAFPPLLAIDPNNPALVYAAASDVGAYRSLDGGNRWQPILAGLPPLNPIGQGADYYQALVSDPRASGTVYLATGGNGVLVYRAQ